MRRDLVGENAFTGYPDQVWLWGDVPVKIGIQVPSTGTVYVTPADLEHALDELRRARTKPDGWLQCICGGRVRLIQTEIDGVIWAQAQCEACHDSTGMTPIVSSGRSLEP